MDSLKSTLKPASSILKPKSLKALIHWWHLDKEMFPMIPMNLFKPYFNIFSADDISNSLLQQVRVHFEDVTFPNYLVLLAQAKVSGSNMDHIIWSKLDRIIQFTII